MEEEVKHQRFPTQSSTISEFLMTLPQDIMALQTAQSANFIFGNELNTGLYSSQTIFSSLTQRLSLAIKLKLQEWRQELYNEFSDILSQIRNKVIQSLRQHFLSCEELLLEFQRAELESHSSFSFDSQPEQVINVLRKFESYSARIKPRIVPLDFEELLSSISVEAQSIHHADFKFKYEGQVEPPHHRSGDQISLEQHPMVAHKHLQIVDGSITIKDMRVNQSHLSQIYLNIQTQSKDFSPNTALLEISLNNNQLKPFIAQALSEVLKISTSLRILNITDNEIGDRAGQILGAYIPASIQHLTLCNIGLKYRSVETISRRFRKLTKLKVLNLSLNPLMDSGTTAVFARMANSTSLTHLILEDVGFTKFSKEIRNPDGKGQLKLQGVNLRGNKISDFNNLSGNLLNHKYLKNLSLCDCGLKVSNQVDRFRSTFIHLERLSILSLNGNTVGDARGRELVECLKENKFLQELYLSSTKLKDKVLIPLIDSRKSFKTLKILDLSSNSFTQTAGKKFAQNFLEFQSLEKVRVDHNDFGDDNLQLFSHSILQKAKKGALMLQYINLCQVGASLQALRQFMDEIKGIVIEVTL